MSSGVRKDRNKVGHGFKESPRKNEPPRLQGFHEQQYHGGIYRGEYEEGKRHGKGSMKYDNGEIYEGGWCAGKSQGVCSYTCAKVSTDSVYKGHESTSSG